MSEQISRPLRRMSAPPGRTSDNAFYVQRLGGQAIVTYNQGFRSYASGDQKPLPNTPLALSARNFPKQPGSSFEIERRISDSAFHNAGASHHNLPPILCGSNSRESNAILQDHVSSQHKSKFCEENVCMKSCIATICFLLIAIGIFLFAYSFFPNEGMDQAMSDIKAPFKEPNDAGETISTNPTISPNVVKTFQKLDNPPSSAPTTQRENSIVKLLLQVSGKSALLDDETSPQHLALNWILFDDREAISPPTNDDEMYMLLQRFALAALYFSTNKEKGWKKQNSFVDKSKNICDWRSDEADSNGFYRGVSLCDDDGRATMINLTGNDLRGSIPWEMGYLTELRVISLSSNQITGTVPQTFMELKKLDKLRLQINSLEGNLDILCNENIVNDIQADCLGGNMRCSCCSVCCKLNGQCFQQ